MRFIENAFENGLRRGERRILGTHLIACRKIYNASEYDLLERFREILSHPVSKIGMTVEDALEDFKGHIAKTRVKGNLSLPNFGSVVIPENALESLQDYFKSKGYIFPLSTAKVILQVILPLVLRLPMQCLKGTVGIYSVDLMNAAGSRYRKAVMQDLKAHYIVVEKKKAIPKSQTAKYFVNVHKVVYMIFKDHPELLMWKY